MKQSRASSAIDMDHGDREARIAALCRFIDWAEREAASLNVADCSICLQLARVALQSHKGDREA